MEKQPAEQVIERMVGAAFPGAPYHAVQQAAIAIADVGTRRAATEADALAFADRFQGQLNPQPEPEPPSGPPDMPPEPAQSKERPAPRPRPRRSLWPRARWTEIMLEQQSLEEESRRSRNQTLLAMGQQHLDLLRQAMADPQLAEILDLYPERMGLDGPESRDRTVRRYLFCQALYEHEVLAFRVGDMDLDTLFGRMRILLQSRSFYEWWVDTRSHRQSLSGDSEEGRVGRMVDYLVERMEETDIDEWWVVGEPPDWLR
ncbi:DUF6082 family protein [Streptomyces sp. NPDC004324]